MITIATIFTAFDEPAAYKLAKELMESDVPRVRGLGVLAVRYRKTSETIYLVTKMLSDKSTIKSGEHLVQALAISVLKAWNLYGNDQKGIVAEVNEAPEQRTQRLRAAEINANQAALDGLRQERLRDPAEPKGICPSCSTLLFLDARECYKCKALFGEGSAWKIQATKTT